MSLGAGPITREPKICSGLTGVEIGWAALTDGADNYKCQASKWEGLLGNFYDQYF